MRRHVLLWVLPALLLCGSPASALELRLHWGACGVAGAAERRFTCDTNAGEDTLVASVLTATPADLLVLPGLRLELWVSTPPWLGHFPDWWDVTASPSCRAGALVFEPATSPVGDCPAYFLPSPGPTVSMTGYVESSHSGAFAEKLFIDVIGPDRPIELTAGGTEIALLRLIVRHDQTSGAGVCAGCGDSLGITFMRLSLIDASGGVHPGGFVSSAAATVSWWPAVPTPARIATWGAIKSRYR